MMQEGITVFLYVAFLGCIKHNAFKKQNLKWLEINYKTVRRFAQKLPLVT